MTPADELLRRIDNAIVVDEIGLETGRYGSFFLKTLYQPILRNTAAGLVPWGVAGSIQPHRDGQPVLRDAFLADVPPDDRLLVESLEGLLRLRNHRNIGIDDLTLLYSFDGRVLGDAPTLEKQVDRLVGLLADAEVDPALLLCELPATEDYGALAELSRALRRRKIRVVVDDLGGGPTSAPRIRHADPEIVRLGSDWFRRIAEVPMALDLLGALVDALQREGRRVLIEGIGTAAHLRAALGTGADLLRGDLLRPARPVGVLFDTDPVDPAALLAEGETVIPFIGNNRPA